MRNKLELLMAKKHELIVPGDKTLNGEPFKLEIRGLTFKDLTILAGMAEKKDNEGAINLLLYSTFRKAIPKEEISNEELKNYVDNIDGGIASHIIKKVMEVSGIEATLPKKDLEEAGREEKKQ